MLVREEEEDAWQVEVWTPHAQQVLPLTDDRKSEALEHRSVVQASLTWFSS